MSSLSVLDVVGLVVNDVVSVETEVSVVPELKPKAQEMAPVNVSIAIEASLKSCIKKLP